MGDMTVSCVTLMTGKSQALCEEMLRAVVKKCEEPSYNVDPTSVVCDFELAPMNAVTAILGPHVSCHGCFFHLC